MRDRDAEEADVEELEAGTRLVLIRHAESVSNVSGIIAGHDGCLGLSELGHRQAEALATRLARTGELAGAAAVYTSLMRRAVQTAAALLPSLGHLTVTRTCQLCEQHPGEADGMTWVEYVELYGPFASRSEPYRPLSPGGEPWAVFQSRVERVLADIARRHPGQLAVIVTHGGVVEASLIGMLGLPEFGSAVSLRATNASLTEWCHTGRRWELLHYNDSAHLGSEPGLRSHAPVPGAIAVADAVAGLSVAARAGGQEPAPAELRGFAGPTSG